MNLSEYLEKKDINYRDFAILVGVDHTTIFKYLNGTRRPSLIVAIRIEDLTNGKVKANAWK